MPPRPAKKAAARRSVPPASKKAEETPVETENVPALPEKAAAVETPEVEATPVAEGALSGEEPMEEDTKGENAEEDEVEDPEEVSEEDNEVEPEEDGNDEDENQPDTEEKPEEHKAENAQVAEGKDDGEDGEDNDGGETDDEGEDDADKEDDPSLHLHTPSEESRKRKEHEIFVGGLSNIASEDDLIKVFSAFGEITSARVAKDQGSKKNKGFAFIQFASADQAKKVITDLKDGIEVQGKQVTVSASTANDTLYVGNICKTWTSNKVRETLKSLGLEFEFELLLPNDPLNEGNSKGFAFLEFTNHFDAMDAFEKLKSSDTRFGRDKSAKVAFAHSMKHLYEEVLLQVKTVYIDGFPSSWDEEKITNICKQYGEIERVELSRNFTKKRKRDFGFISFATRESALACVEGINNGQVGDDECKLSANLAKYEKKRPSLKPKGNKEDANDKTPKSNKQKKSDPKVTGSNKRTPDSSGFKKRKGKKLGGDFGAKSFKRQRSDGNVHGRTSRFTRASGRHVTDMEPHAGLLPAGGRGHTAPRYNLQSRHADYTGPTGGPPQYPFPAYGPYQGYQAAYPPYAGSVPYPPRRAYY